MTKCLRSLQQIGLRRNVWRTCLLAGSALLAMSLFFSCNQNVRPGSSAGGAIEKTYTVNHNWENVEGTGYDTVPQTGLKGLVGSETKAVAQEKEGFELDTAKHPAGKIKQESIKADGSTVVNIYYARKTITLTFDPNGGTIDGKAENKTLSGKFGETILKLNEPKKDRHSFTEWEPKLPETFPSTDTTYKAVWVEGTLPTYTVQHWQQQIEDLTGKVYDGTTHATPNYKLKDTETKHGKEGATTAATSKEKAKGYEGFDKPEITQQKITADGKTVVAIYYLRKQVTLTFKPNGGKFGESTEDKTVQGKFGEKVTDSIPAPTNDSKKFAGWKSENEVTLDPPATFPEKNTVYIAQWKNPQAGSYKVIHWKQPITGDTYTDKEEVPASGTIDEDTQATAKTYPGFHLSKDRHPDGKIKQEKITADDKTVVNIYYDRDVFTATFKLDNGQNDIVQTGRFEAALTKPTPKKTGMAFDKWEPNVPATFTADGTYTAKWETPAPEQANYKVEHWTQQIKTDGKVYDASKHKSPNYALQDSEDNKRGKIGDPTSAEAKEYTGFEKPAPSAIHQETIQADGTTVVKIYYVRKDITLTFDAKGGTIDGQSTKTLIGKYGEKIKTDDVHDPIKDNGDKFSEWSPKENIETFPAETKTYEAQWATFDAIVVTTWPRKTTYTVGELFDPTGMEIHAKYSDGSSPRLQDTEYETDFATVSANAGNDKTVTVTHKKYPSKKATFKVTIKAPPSETFAIGDIIDGTNNKKYKAADFTALPASSSTWSNYYVIVKVNGASYVGVRYLDNNYGSPRLGNSPDGTYRDATFLSSENYLTEQNIKDIVDNATTVKESMDKIKTISGLTAYTNENCIAKNGYNFTNGNGDRLYSSSPGSFIPFAAREFN